MKPVSEKAMQVNTQNKKFNSSNIEINNDLIKDNNIKTAKNIAYIKTIEKEKNKAEERVNIQIKKDNKNEIINKKAVSEIE